MAFNRYSLSLWAEVNMTLISGLISLIALIISIPFIFGILMSVTIISGLCCLNSSSPSSPLDAVKSSLAHRFNGFE